jgi:hypothetical protein
MLWICQGCTSAYSVGAPACPQCGSAEYLEEGAEEGVTPEVVVESVPDVEEDEDA